MTIGSTEAELLYIASLPGSSHCVGRISLGQGHLAGLTSLKVFTEIQSSSALGTFYHLSCACAWQCLWVLLSCCFSCPSYTMSFFSFANRLSLFF